MKRDFWLKSCLMLLSFVLPLTGCRGDDEQISIDETKSQLYVGVWDGGFRNNWVTTWGKKFEALHAETSFEPGKKGVEIVPNLSKVYLADTLAYNIEKQKDEICFSEQTNYYFMRKQNCVYDISEWVKTPLTEYGENVSIEDKLSDLDKEYYGDAPTDGTYFGLPWYTSFNPINYDINLFEENNFYFAAEGQGDPDGFVWNESTPKSLGPDGQTGIGADGINRSYDDGLPATYDDFFKLCDRIVACGIVPIIWGGAVQSYLNSTFHQLAADFEGYDNFILNYTFDGTADHIVKKITDGVAEVERVLISIGNGNITKQQAGWYYGLKFMERLITTVDDSGNPKYYNPDDCFSQTFSHLSAQTKFLRSNHTASIDPIAMLIDGTWWYNEATETFDAMSGIGGCSKEERRIGIMMPPKIDKEHLGDPTLMQSWISTVYVRKNISPEKVNLIRAFFRYIHTDEALSSYMKDSCGIRPYKFELTGVTLEQLPIYTQQQYFLYQNFKTVTPYARNSVCKNFLNEIHKNYTTFVGTTSYNLVTRAFRDGVTAEDYFAGMARYWNDDDWAKYTK